MSAGGRSPFPAFLPLSHWGLSFSCGRVKASLPFTPPPLPPPPPPPTRPPPPPARRTSKARGRGSGRALKSLLGSSCEGKKTKGREERQDGRVIDPRFPRLLCLRVGEKSSVRIGEIKRRKKKSEGKKEGDTLTLRS